MDQDSKTEAADGERAQPAQTTTREPMQAAEHAAGDSGSSPAGDDSAPAHARVPEVADATAQVATIPASAASEDAPPAPSSAAAEAPAEASSVAEAPAKEASAAEASAQKATSEAKPESTIVLADRPKAAPAVPAAETRTRRWPASRAEIAELMEGLGAQIGASRRSLRKFADRVTSRIGERLELATVPSKSKLKAGAEQLQSLARRLPKPELETLRAQAGVLAERLAIRDRAAAIGGRIGLGRKTASAEPAAAVRVKPARRKAAEAGEVPQRPAATRRRSAAAAKTPAAETGDTGATKRRAAKTSAAKTPRKRAVTEAGSEKTAPARSRAAKASETSEASAPRSRATQAGAAKTPSTRSRRKADPAPTSDAGQLDTPDTNSSNATG